MTARPIAPTSPKLPAGQSLAAASCSPVAVLYARADSNYKAMENVDVWDAERDARNWPGGCPVVAHPPCRAWSALAHMAKPRPDEKDLARHAPLTPEDMDKQTIAAAGSQAVEPDLFTEAAKETELAEK